MNPVKSKGEADELRHTIETAYADPGSADPAEVREACLRLRAALSAGRIRAATPEGRDWTVHAWVKKGILLGFRFGRPTLYGEHRGIRFLDHDTFPPRRLSQRDGVRMVPGGSAIREGAYVAPGVVCMPPMYVNVGAYVGEGSMVDSHALVGSCAQIGRRVHLSAAAQIGGVLEPVGARPVIIEDDVLVGGGCGVYEGTWVRRRAVLAPGTILSASTPLFDLVHGRVLRGGAHRPLTVPEGAVVVPGSRAAAGALADAHGLQLYAPVIVKYRDGSTDAATALEVALRTHAHEA